MSRQARCRPRGQGWPRCCLDVATCAVRCGARCVGRCIVQHEELASCEIADREFLQRPSGSKSTSRRIQPQAAIKSKTALLHTAQQRQAQCKLCAPENCKYEPRTHAYFLAQNESRALCRAVRTFWTLYSLPVPASVIVRTSSSVLTLDKLTCASLLAASLLPSTPPMVVPGLLSEVSAPALCGVSASPAAAGGASLVVAAELAMACTLRLWLSPYTGLCICFLPCMASPTPSSSESSERGITVIHCGAVMYTALPSKGLRTHYSFHTVLE